MPVSLPPIDRRQFLGAGLAGLLLGRSTAAPVDPHVWALLSDSHIAADPKAVSRENRMADRLTEAVKEVLALPSLPAGAIVDGDLALKVGLPEDYATFLKLVKPLRDAGMPLHATLGNHDDRTNFLKAVPEVSKAEKPVADKVVGVVKAERARFVLLDSLAIVDKVPGEYGPAQLKWLAKTLDAEPTVPTIIVGHHNPTETGSPSLTDTLAFLDVVAPRKQVKAYIFGHTHAWKVSQHKTGIHFVNLPAVAYPFAKGQAIGWTVLTLKPDGAKLELRAADKHALNGQVHELTWRS